MKKIIFILFLGLFLQQYTHAQGTSCNNPEPFCSDSAVTFPAGTNTGDAMNTDPGNNYGCLGSAPNPAWYYMEISNPGSLTIDITNSNNVDVDFILWGPYPDYNTAINNCGNLGAAGSGTSPNSVIDCSYSASANETANITNAQTGDVYILLITNFSNTPTNISFSNNGGTASTSCNIVSCTITGLTVNTGSCDSITNTYSTTGTVTFTSPPSSGTLIVEDCNGNQDVLSPPFNSPMSYTINNQPANGNACTISAYFSSTPTCDTTIAYTAPSSCLGCLMQITDTIYSHISCNGANDGTIQIVATGGATQYSIDNGATWQTTSTFTGLAPGTYVCVADDGTGCQASVTVTLTEPLPLSIPKTITNASCFGVCDGSIVIAPQGGTQPYTYSWTNGDTSPNNDSLCAGTYTITVTDANSCTLDSTFTVTEPPQLQFTSSTTDATCYSQCDGTGTVQGTNPLITYGYQWNNGATTSTANNLCAGNYYCIVSDINSGCNDTAFITINEPTQLLVTTSPDTTICVGTSATLSASATGGTPPYSYSWDNGATTSVQTVTPAGNSTYTVTVTDSNGCVSSPVTISVSLYPVLSLTTSADAFICPGQSATISASVSGGNGGPYTYLWSNNNTNASQTVSPTVTTTYYVTATDNCSPQVTDSVTINVLPLPVPTFTADTLAGCEPLTVTFYNTSANTSNPLWNFGDGTTGAGDTIIHTYTDNGTYDVQLTVSSAGGCIDSNRVQNYITVYNTPIADFYYLPDSVDMLNPIVEFFDQSYGSITYWAWSFNFADSAFVQNPVYVFPEDTGTYYISLYVEDNNGCKDSVTKLIRVAGVYTIYVPNAFTPTDTKNVNDYFRPYGIGITDEDFRFSIFDRWGNKIYESTSFKADGWDGSYQGNSVPLDVYVWKLEFKDITGKHHILHGHVTIVK